VLAKTCEPGRHVYMANRARRSYPDFLPYPHGSGTLPILTRLSVNFM
jgi:hypothetical protein